MIVKYWLSNWQDKSRYCGETWPSISVVHQTPSMDCSVI
jgi:hypothetical protein